MNRVIPLADSDSTRQVLADVAEYGWHVVHILPDERGPGWSFSIGLFHTFGHPEFVVFGLPSERAQPIINGLGARIRSGSLFTHDSEDTDVLTGYPVRFVAVPESCSGNYFGYAIWFYRHQPFPVLQVVWPDRSGRFPWQSGYDPSLQGAQPVLGSATSQDTHPK
ncbi:MAG: DUF4262 domain-containing protein [Candidatus Accumulibacter sp.]|uniref:DUF4262 domain-containing protein n=1 Tax=Accumulibacter sp. TaxID=2053492 RepID=UPI0028797656|nr:DUF4262 domain-containing protein [Accumulibacter sp.]MDS4015890.1 DUF4262 domain-containing protein [Accumulibacter sp.]